MRPKPRKPIVRDGWPIDKPQLTKGAHGCCFHCKVPDVNGVFTATWRILSWVLTLPLFTKLMPSPMRRRVESTRITAMSATNQRQEVKTIGNVLP